MVAALELAGRPKRPNRSFPFLIISGANRKPVPAAYNDLGRDSAIKESQVVSISISNSPVFVAAIQKDRFIFTFPGTMTTLSNVQVPTQILERVYKWGRIRGWVRQAPTGSALTLRIIRVSDSTVIASLTIAAGTRSASASPTVGESAQGDELAMEITAVGSVVRGRTLTVILEEL